MMNELTFKLFILFLQYLSEFKKTSIILINDSKEMSAIA